MENHVFKNSFYLKSFIILLAVDVTYTVLALLFNPQHYHFGQSELISLAWFLLFFLLPAWLSASIIIPLRNRGKSPAVFEWLFYCTLSIIGNWAVDYLLSKVLQWVPSMGTFIFFNGFLWATIFYFGLKVYEGRKRIQQEKKAKQKAQLETLRYQLNPHFMFNSLNTISAYIHSKPDTADEVLHNLADVLRYSLDTAEKTTVSLSEELAIIDTYLAIEQVRFGERLTVVKNIDSNLLTQPIPPLLLQPIIENSIKHCAQQKQLTITITIEKMANYLMVRIEDNGLGFSEKVIKQKHGQGIGLKNLKSRIEQIPKSTLILKNTPGACIEMEIKL